MKSSVNTVNKAWSALLDLIFPEACLGCKIQGEILCDRCIGMARRAERETPSHIYACYDYRDPLIKRIVWSLKYYKRQNLGDKLGISIYDSLLEDISDIRIFAGSSSIYVIPVPLSKSRQKSRGYNQAERIAKSFCSYGNKEGDAFLLRNDIVIKIKDTLPQARITNRNERLRNIKGAFRVEKPNTVRGKTIILIDDVATTGGTLSELMKILKKSGAKKVVGFTVAH